MKSRLRVEAFKALAALLLQRRRPQAHPSENLQPFVLL